MEPELEEVELQGILETLQRYLEARIPRLSAGVKLELEVPPDLPRCRGMSPPHLGPRERGQERPGCPGRERVGPSGSGPSKEPREGGADLGLGYRARSSSGGPE